MEIKINNKKFNNQEDFIEYIYSQGYEKLKDKELIFKMSLETFQKHIAEMLKNERKEILVSIKELLEE